MSDQICRAFACKFPPLEVIGGFRPTEVVTPLCCQGSLSDWLLSYNSWGEGREVTTGNMVFFPFKMNAFLKNFIFSN